jgi:hypothetical protein
MWCGKPSWGECPSVVHRRGLRVVWTVGGKGRILPGSAQFAARTGYQLYLTITAYYLFL